MNKYSEIYQLALQGYTNQAAERPGYKKTWFSWLRHSYKPYPHIEKLKEDLTAAADDAAAKLILAAYFKDSKTKFKHHSFSRFLLDQLQMQFRSEQWEAHDPTPIVFYRHDKDQRLYRGTEQNPQDAFKNGMLDQAPKDKINPYLKTSSFNVGISTTKDYKIAEGYAMQAWLTPTAKGMIFRASKPVYIYEIDYRDGNGIDIMATTLARQANSIERFDASQKDEVNILQKILPEDIVGVWEVTVKEKHFIKNSAYQAIKHTPDASVPERLEQLFKTAAELKR
jgi:hypothetical protein